MTAIPDPTERELAILKVLWDHGDRSVREVYEILRVDIPIVQNTVQAFLRTMEEKGLVQHRVEGRTFLYSAVLRRDQTSRKMVSNVLQRVFDGAIDQLVERALEVRQPSATELAKLRQLLKSAEGKAPSKKATKTKRKGGRTR